MAGGTAQVNPSTRLFDSSSEHSFGKRCGLANQVRNLAESSSEILPMQGYYVGRWVSSTGIALPCHGASSSERRASWVNDRLAEKHGSIGQRHSGIMVTVLEPSPNRAVPSGYALKEKFYWRPAAST